MTPTGLTADGTWQIGVRRTLPLPLDVAWARLLELVAADPEAGPIRSRTDGEVMRLPYGDGTTLQLRVLEAASGTTVAVHHERLPDEAARKAMRDRWTAALETL